MRPAAARTAPQLARVVVWLDRRALEDLELLVRYRHGRRSRSAIVREAVDWLRAKEAAWLLRARAQEERRRREEAELRAARETAGEEREQRSRDELVAEAVAIAAEGD